jgi:hypothetical protein
MLSFIAALNTNVKQLLANEDEGRVIAWKGILNGVPADHYTRSAVFVQGHWLVDGVRYDSVALANVIGSARTVADVVA